MYYLGGLISTSVYLLNNIPVYRVIRYVLL